MVFGAIINWTVGKTLDLTFDTIWWIAKKTGQGIYNAGHYLIISKNKNREFQIIEKEIENESEHKINLENTKEGLAQRYEIVKLLKEQNKLLAEEIRLLQNNSNQSNEQTDKKNTEEVEEVVEEIKEKKD